MNLSRAALVVVDMQNDFCHPDGYYARKGFAAAHVAEIIPMLRRMVTTAREANRPVVFTRMVHDPLVPDVMSRHRLLPPGWRATDRRLAPGTWGAEIVEGLRPQEGERVFDKCDYSGFFGTGLEGYLRRRGVDTVVITGAVDYACVLHTAFDAFCRDFDVVLPHACAAGWDPELSEAARRIIELLLGRVVSCEEVLAALELGAR
ncbi:MAG TPA: isochorismatase family cysteine hydrolase [Candidatus Dormibacteraeota bacterium]|nr:isochorismatase family cysteine hydrolase [Candidatus Dormibacteraeota bacterium]